MSSFADFNIVGNMISDSLSVKPQGAATGSSVSVSDNDSAGVDNATNWGLIIGVGIALVVLIVAGVVIYKKRK